MKSEKIRHCKFCNSTNLINKGLQNKKLRLLCNDCNKYQSEVENDKRIKHPPEEIDAAIIAYVLCNSYRTTAKILEKMFDKKFAWTTIRSWIESVGLKLNYRNSQQTKFYDDLNILEVDMQNHIEKGIIPAGYGVFCTSKKGLILKIKDKRPKKLRESHPKE